MLMDTKQTITVTHINIRQSISFMLLKLAVVEIIGSFLTMLFYWPLTYADTALNISETLLSPYILLFFGTMIFKLFLTLFVILEWLNEYYEITPHKISHRRGVIFHKIEEYDISHIMSIEVDQGILGKLFNYGTLRLYDRPINKQLYLYLIHNPFRYYKIIDELLPGRDKEQHKVIETFMPKNSNVF